MPDNKIKGFEIVTPLDAKVTWERCEFAKSYWACFPSGKFLHDDEVDEQLELMKEFGCQVIVHYHDGNKRSDTIVIPPNCQTIECGVMVRKVKEPYWQCMETIVKSINPGLWWRDVIQKATNTEIFRTHQQLNVDDVLFRLNRRLKLGEEIRYYDHTGTRIYV